MRRYVAVHPARRGARGRRREQLRRDAAAPAQRREQPPPRLPGRREELALRHPERRGEPGREVRPQRRVAARRRREQREDGGPRGDGGGGDGAEVVGVGGGGGGGQGPGRAAALAVADGDEGGGEGGEGGLGGGDGVEEVVGVRGGGEVGVEDWRRRAGGGGVADAQAGVVRGDDDIALERHDVGPGILVPEVPDVRGCAFGQHAGRAVRPAYDGVAGDVAESPRKVGPEDVGGGRDGGSIEGDGLIGYPREGDGGWECVEGRVGHVFHSQEGAGWDGRGPVARDAIEALLRNLSFLKILGWKGVQRTGQR